MKSEEKVSVGKENYYFVEMTVVIKGNNGYCQRTNYLQIKEWGQVAVISKEDDMTQRT